MAASANALVTHRVGLFHNQSFTGEIVQIEVELLKAVFKQLGYRNPEGDTSTLIIIPLALSDDKVDFHLSFTAGGGYTRQCHFLVRLEGRQNECLYWFYSLRSVSGELKWSWDGCAGQGDANTIMKHSPKGLVYTSHPLQAFLDVAKQWIVEGKAEVAAKRQATLNASGARTGTHDQLTLQKRS